MKFPGLFERFPFPILINSAFLKLSDVFRVGNNFQRLCVLKVTQQSEKHLDKILSIDEFLRRIFAVMHSNDPIARAITLRVLGSIALLISERKNVHHSIRMSLDSHDHVEVDAAIFATRQFCAKSRTFSVGVCNKLSELIEGLATPMEMKLKLVPIFQYMHHDTESATKAWKLCTSLLSTYSSNTFVLSVLHALSCLAAASLFNISSQIQLLLSYLIDDPRQSVKRQALLDANMLARQSPHIWESNHVKILCEFLSSTPYNNLQVGALYVLVTLSHSVAAEILDSNQVLEVICSQSCSDSVTVCALSNELIVNIGLSRLRADPVDKELCEQAAINLETTIVECCLHEQSKALEISLLCINRLVSHDSSWASNFAETFVGLLTSSSSTVCLQIAKGLVSLATQAPSSLERVKSELYKHFVFICEMEVNERSSKVREFQSLLVAIATLVFQAHHQGVESPANQQEVKQMTMQNLSVLKSSTKYWTMYRVGKQAARQGFHALAQEIFSSITSAVASVHLHCWLKALSDFCEAESLLSAAKDTLSQITKKTSQAITSFQKGLVSLKAAVTSINNLDFHHEFMNLRMQTLQAHVFLLGVCASIRSCPPSAVAKSIVMATGQDIYLHSRQVVQMRDCRDKFSSLASNYGKLYRKSFDADPVTLHNIETHQQSCLLFAYAIDLLMNRNGLGRMSSNFDHSSNSGKIIKSRLEDKCREILDELQHLYVEVQDKPVSNVEVECLSKMSLCIIGVPLKFPRYFFNSIQSTTIKLAISPSQPINNEPHTISVESQMALKIEGVIRHGQNPGLFRKVQSITLLVAISSEGRKETTDLKSFCNPPAGPLHQTVEPHNDYFSTQFLLAFPLPNLYTVTVTVGVVDEKGRRWETGPHTSLLVKALEVPSRAHRRLP